MRVVLVHNYYQFPGGEDAVFRGERELLAARRNTILEVTKHNDEIKSYRFPERMRLTWEAVFNLNTKKEFIKLITSKKPDVVHFHNTFPLISPSAYFACQEMDAPVVQTLHNYRLLCPRADFYRAGGVCEKCLGKTPPWPGILHRCYQSSRSYTSVVAAMLTFHRWRNTWGDQVDIYIAPTEFARRKFIEGGIPGEKITVKPDFVYPDYGMLRGRGQYMLFVGRLSPEKGLHTLLRAWRFLSEITLKIVGDGPLMSEARAFVQAHNLKCVEMLGRRASDEIFTFMKEARCLILPSDCYESFGRVAIEAFACGVPVIASRLGAMTEIVHDGRTGLHFSAGDPGDLARKVVWAWGHEREMREMGFEARIEYEQKYTAEHNYEKLMSIYERAIKNHEKKVT